jgi:hypothetical protein
VGETSASVWQALWPEEKCRQASFHVFGMELLAALDLGMTNQFFNTFFSLPSLYWRGFLGSNLSSAQLVAFAMLTFAIAPVSLAARSLVGAVGPCWRRCPLRLQPSTHLHGLLLSQYAVHACLREAPFASMPCMRGPLLTAAGARVQVSIKAKLVTHLLTDPAGKYLAKHYLDSSSRGGEQQQAAAALLLLYLGGAATQLR